MSKDKSPTEMLTARVDEEFITRMKAVAEKMNIRNSFAGVKSETVTKSEVTRLVIEIGLGILERELAKIEEVPEVPKKAA